MPALAHAVVPRSGSDQAWIEICTVTGMVSIRAAAAEPGDEQGHSPLTMKMGASTCDWCAHHAPAGTVLASPDAGLRIAVPPKLVADAFLHAPRPLFAWACAQPRAPPVLA